MKKHTFTLLALGFAVAGACFLLQKTHHEPSLRMPAGGGEEGREARQKWERMRLADPATGQIPAGITLQERWFADQMAQPVSERSGPTWQFRGPWNYGGRTRALVFDVTNENKILAGGVSGGIWMSEDGGASWTRKSPLNAHPGCVSIAQDTRPGHTDTWYALAGEIYGTSASEGPAFYFGDGMYKSVDGGHTWTVLDATDNGNPQQFSDLWQTGYRVLTNPAATADIVYASTYNCVFRSTNGGASWAAVLGGLNTSTYSYASDLVITSTGVLYAAMSSQGDVKGIWRSTNGTNWTNILPANFPATYGRIVAGINPNNENEVYFLAETPGSGHYNHYIDSDDWTSLWRYNYISGDGTGDGGQWTDLSANLPNTGTEFDRFACQGGYDLVVKVQPGTNHVFIGGTNIYRSTDGFTTPDNTTHIGGYKPGTSLPYFELYTNHHPDIHELIFLPSNPNVLLSGTDGGIHRTNDCNAANVEWISLNNGYQTTQFYTAMIEHTIAGDPLIIGGLQDNGNLFVNSTNTTAPWKQTVNGDGAFGAILNNKSAYVLAIQQGKLAKCAIDDNGNVTAYMRFDPADRKKSDYPFINQMAIDPNDENILYFPAGRHLYRQDNLGAIQLLNQWDSISTGWTKYPDTLLPIIDDNWSHEFTAIAVSKSNPAHRLYVGTSRNRLYRVDDAHTGAPSLTSLPAPISNNQAYVSCIAVDPFNADHVIVTYSNYNIYSIFRSENGGQSWQKVGGNLENNVNGNGSAPSIRWVSILPLPDGTRKYFCATSVGLYSADTLVLHNSNTPGNGTQWVRESLDGIGSTVVDHIDVRPADGLVVAATHGNGLFSANFMPASGTETPENSVRVTAMPNPATDVLYFQVEGRQAGACTLHLYDLQGRLVRRAGWSGASGRIDVQELPRGVYVYQLSGYGWRQSGKVVLKL